jgi:TPP-dependent pyruvate/acetoin dehydrogenase alpha subunit
MLNMETRNIFKGYQRLSLETLKRLLYSMIKIRKIEEAICNLYPEQEIRCPVHLCVGQEAIPAGVCNSLKSGDVVFASHRSHGYYIALGGDSKALMAELYGKISGCTKGKGGSQHLAAPEVGLMGSSAIVAGVIPIAVGAALSFAMQKKKNVAIVDFGDGATDEGTFYESLNFAALKNLPVVFICENNYYATHAHQSKRQVRDNIAQRAKAFGVFGVRIDGNNVLEVARTCRNAVGRARTRKGPTLIECRTYRWLEHVGVAYDYNLGYRSERELRRWMKKCPIKMLEEFLKKNRLIKESKIIRVSERINLEISEAVKFAKKSAFPGSGELLKDVYSV